MGKKQKTPKLLRAVDLESEFGGFASERDRIKYISQHYGQMDIAAAFSAFYDVQLESNPDNIETTTIEVGGNYTGTVESIKKDCIVFSIPGIKDEIVSHENWGDALDAVKFYLMKHDNKLRFEVRSHANNKFSVSVINGYYNLWKDKVNYLIKTNGTLTVHIDELTKGGYLCHAPIDTLVELTGKEYTHSVFIPGSNIVLNIESKFERWLGQDVDIVPQNFTKFRTVGQLEETSLIGSRKKALQNIGAENMLNIYNTDQLLHRNANYVPATYTGVVTGIIDSNKKTGLFVELDGMFITGLLPVPSSKLLDYHPGDTVSVNIAQFEVKEGRDPFVFNRAGKLIACNTRVIFKFV